MDDEKINEILDMSSKLNSLANVVYGYCSCFAESSEEMSDLLDSSGILKQTAKELNLQLILLTFQEFS